MMNVFRCMSSSPALRLSLFNCNQNLARICTNANLVTCKSPVLAVNHQRLVSTVGAKTMDKDEGLAKKMMKKIAFVAVNKFKVKGTAYILYEGIVDNINYVKFFEELGIPDTFYSWFAITELHIWMVSVRAMAEGEEGRFLRNSIIEALWSDVAQRIKKMGAGSSSELKEKIFELSEQLQASLIAYDEGLQSDDIVLAGALWRRLYQQRNVDMQVLETLVKYVRKQMTLLDNTSRDQIFKEKRIDWEPLT